MNDWSAIEFDYRTLTFHWLRRADVKIHRELLATLLSHMKLFYGQEENNFLFIKHNLAWKENLWRQ